MVLSADRSVCDALGTLTGWRISTATLGDVVEAYRSGVPDAVVLRVADQASCIPDLLRIRKRPIVCIGPDHFETARAAFENGVGGWLSGPATPEAIATQVELAVRWFDQLESLTTEKNMLSQMIETRKLVERAKAIFMRRLNLDEPTAHKRLQQESQNRRIAIAELARRIIESDEILVGDSMPSPNQMN
jgi:response regulator NasT